MYLVYNSSGPIGGEDSRCKRFAHLGVVGATVTALLGLRQALPKSSASMFKYICT